MSFFGKMHLWLKDATTGKGLQASSGGNGFNNDLVLPMIFSVTTCIALGLIVAWINLNRFQMGYALPRLQAAVRKQADIQANLRAERENILSRLGVKAEELGLYAARPGQVRRMDIAPNVPLQDEPLQHRDQSGEQAKSRDGAISGGNTRE